MIEITSQKELQRVMSRLRGAAQHTATGCIVYSNTASGEITAPKIIMLDKPKNKGNQ